MRRLFFTGALLSFLLASCSGPVAQVVPAVIPAATSTATLVPTTAPTSTPSVSPTPDPYAKYTINYLRSRQYGGGQIDLVETAGQYNDFTRYMIRYPSDGLTIAGFMDVPNGLGPFPVIIALHGYVDPSVYNTLDYTTRYADQLASAGYLVLHPNLRGFPPSSSGDDLFRVGMATDVLNLIAIVKETGGKKGPLQLADPQRIGVWGHSMGGGIATRVITVSPDIKAAVLYSPVSGDEQKNYTAVAAWSSNQAGIEERAVPLTELPLISPMYFYQDVQAAVSINQGMADPVVPVQWSKDTCDQLQEMGKTVECHYYDTEGHTFTGQGDHTFLRLTLLFFDKYLRGS
jgi:uncharacterized protein